MEAVMVEVRAAEGGMDAKDLVNIQLSIYTRLCTKRGLTAEIVEERPGIVIIRVSGLGVMKLFQDEAGGHRFQRTPPTEKRGRVHTSTITVAVLLEPSETQIYVDPRDLEITTCRGTGPGGQARNTTDSAVQVKHRPSGLIVRCDSERSQHQNKASALALLRARLWQAKQEAENGARAAERKSQVGAGMRADKRHTVRYQDEQVHDHVTGRRWRLRDYLRGDWQ